MGAVLKAATRKLDETGRKRNKLHALRKKSQRQGKTKKARNIRKSNLGSQGLRARNRRAKITIENELNRAISEALKQRQPKVIVTEKLDVRGPARSKEVSRRVSDWHRRRLQERIEFKASAARLPSRASQPGLHLAKLSRLRLFESGEPPGGQVSVPEMRARGPCRCDCGDQPEGQKEGSRAHSLDAERDREDDPCRKVRSPIGTPECLVI